MTGRKKRRKRNKPLTDHRPDKREKKMERMKPVANKEIREQFPPFQQPQNV
jgi:hypothetical protein